MNTTKAIQTINTLASDCAKASKDLGFHDDETQLREFFDAYLNDDSPIRLWTESAILQAELARIGSEIGEAVEAVRKPGPDHHLPEFDNFTVELADTLIRIFDTAGRRNLPLGEAVVAKMKYNRTRPYKHGKNS